MDTLYDLLGALPRDDAEGLRAAFRRAVKGAHPDLRPGDPDAALKFRQIVRANEILIDPEQREAYDHLLALARAEQRWAFARPLAASIHSLASGVMALAGISIMTVGGYLLFMQISTASVAPANNVGVAVGVSPDIAPVSRTDPQYPTDQSSVIAKRESKHESTSIPADAIARSAALPPTNLESLPALNFGAAPDLVLNDAQFFHARGVFAYRNGNLNGAIADLDQAIQLDPGFSASYIDRGIVFYRLPKFDRAFADIARAKRIAAESQPKSMPTMAKKPRSDQTGIPISTTSLSRRPTAAAQNSSPEGGYASATFQ
jgi:tetratricopeptide (TPR) repeat protein